MKKLFNYNNFQMSLWVCGDIYVCTHLTEEIPNCENKQGFKLNNGAGGKAESA